MSRVITVTQVHFQACKWFAICWLSYANVPCGVLTSWGGGNTMDARGRPAGLEQGKDTRVRFFFFKREELENFQRSRLSPVKTSSYFSSSSSSPLFLNFWWTVAKRTLFFTHPQSINERKLFLDVFQLPTRETVASVVNSPRRTPRPPPLHLSRKRAFITPAPCLISDTANVTSNHQTLCARGTITGARLSPWQTSQAARPGGGEEKAIM